MIRILLVLVLLVSSGLFVSAQTSHHHEDDGHAAKYCSTNDALRELLEKNPEIAPLIEQADSRLEEFTANYTADDRSGNNYIIPVVFHVIHANGSENISDEQIFDAVDIMTKDFTLANEDISMVISEFESIVANVGIEFRLARLDPQGNCTNGIVRVESNTTFSGGENLKSVSPTWPRSNYMNIWVAADLSSGAAGYTYTPGSVDGPWGSDADGIVIKHTYVGSIGTGSPTRSRALTHEVGHWINLRHTWGGTNDPGLASNCNSDDNVSDTPNTIGWTSCSLYGETCGSLDNVQNFMEYSYCSRMFTQGQRTRMLAALNSSTANRNNLHSNQNLVQTGVFGDAELCKVQISTSINQICAGDSVVYTDHSYHNVASRSWTFEGGTPSTANGEEVVVYYNNAGTYDVHLEVTADNGETISDSFNNTVKVWPSEGVSLSYQENFENAPDLDSEWWVPNYGTTHEWHLSDQVSGASGNHALMLQNRSLTSGDLSEIWSQPIDLSNTNTDVSITFKYAYARRNPGNYERLKLFVSTDCGNSWNLRGIWTNNFETVPFTNAFWLPSSPSHWETVTVDNLTGSQLVSNFRFKFAFESDGGNNIFIDDINITGPNTTSVNDLDISSDISVFPNPATSDVNLSISGEGGYTFDLRMTNYLGQDVITRSGMVFNGGKEQYTLNTSSLSAGVYVLTIDSSEGKRAVKRIMIIR